MRRARVERVPAAGERVALPADVAHHLIRVLRLGQGDVVEAFDGHGRSALVVLDGDGDIVGRGDMRVSHVRRPLELLLGVPKGGALETVVRMATEIGVTRIHLVLAERSVARPDRPDRVRRWVEEAARQCGRSDVPPVGLPCSLADAWAATSPDCVRLFAQPGSASAPACPAGAAVAIGPEGGWTDGERHASAAAGARPMGLGPQVLRTDTAAAVALGWLSISC